MPEEAKLPHWEILLRELIEKLVMVDQTPEEKRRSEAEKAGEAAP